MKVGDIMQKQVDYVTSSASVKDVALLIFGHGINGVPVVKDRKVIGFITGRDILQKFFPSMEEYMEDPIHTSDFEVMEKKASEILGMKVEKIMAKNPLTITAETPILRAQSLMFVNKIGRLPVVDEKDHLIGILSQGDIFYTIVGEKLPIASEEGFFDWMARDYDQIIDWKKRLSKEIPDLVSLFKKHNVNRVVDISSSTGEHTVALGEHGFEAYGLEASQLMHRSAEAKKEQLSDKVKSRITFLAGNYKNNVKLVGKADAVIYMGNGLPHVIETEKQILDEVSKILPEKNAVILLQIINYRKILENQNGLQHFVVRKSQDRLLHEQAFLSFFTPDGDNRLSLNRATMNYTGKKWIFRQISSTPVMELDKKTLTEMLKKHGFKDLTFYGGMFYDSLFDKEFDEQQSDWLNVIAKR